jgi:hypothetical protein
VSGHVEHTVHNGGLAALAQHFKTMRGTVKAGFIKGKSHPETEDDGFLTVAQVAAWNELGTHNADGTVHTPERAFMRHGITQGKMKFSRLNRINLILTLKGRMSYEQAIGQLGAMAAGEIKRAIATSKTWAEPNADATIAAKTRDGKKGDQPLKDTGNMEQAVTWGHD